MLAKVGHPWEGFGIDVGDSWSFGDKWAYVGDGCWQRLATNGTVLVLVLAIVGTLWGCVGAVDGHCW